MHYIVLAAKIIGYGFIGISVLVVLAVLGVVALFASDGANGVNPFM